MNNNNNNSKGRKDNNDNNNKLSDIDDFCSSDDGSDDSVLEIVFKKRDTKNTITTTTTIINNNNNSSTNDRTITSLPQLTNNKNKDSQININPRIDITTSSSTNDIIEPTTKKIQQHNEMIDLLLSSSSDDDDDDDDYDKYCRNRSSSIRNISNGSKISHSESRVIVDSANTKKISTPTKTVLSNPTQVQRCHKQPSPSQQYRPLPDTNNIKTDSDESDATSQILKRATVVSASKNVLTSTSNKCIYDLSDSDDDSILKKTTSLLNLKPIFTNDDNNKNNNNNVHDTHSIGSLSDDDDELAELKQAFVKTKTVATTLSKPPPLTTVINNNITTTLLNDQKITTVDGNKKQQGTNHKKNDTAAAGNVANERKRQREVEKQKKLDEQLVKKQMRESKKVATALEKENKKQKALEHKQATGKLYQKEIGILLDPNLFRPTNDIDGYVDSNSSSSSVSVSFSSLSNDLRNDGYEFVYKYDSAIGVTGCSIIQWIRNDATNKAGGAQAAFDELMSVRNGQSNNNNNNNNSNNSQQHSYQHIKTIAVLVHDAKEFLKLIDQSKTSLSNVGDDTYDSNIDGANDDDDDDDDDDGDDYDDDNYPALENWLRRIQHSWHVAWKVHFDQNEQQQEEQKGPRIIVILYRAKQTLSQLWIEFNSNGKKKKKTTKNKQPEPATLQLSQQPPTDFQLEDAITWMLIQFQVECIHCDTYEEVSQHVVKMTRMFGQEPYQKTITELDCRKKLTSQCSDFDDDYTRANDCWIRQLEQIPRVSKAAALHVAARYPTAMSLWQAYQDPKLTESAKIMLLENHLSDNASKQTKTSEFIYRVMTSNNPNEILT